MATEGSHDEILDLVRRWAEAEERNDPDLLDGLLAAGFVGVGPFGFVLTREQWLGRFRGGLHNSALTVKDHQVHHHGVAAVVVGVQAQQTSFQGRDNSGRFRLTAVAVRPKDRWLLASVHVGPLQEPPVPAAP
jgi:ketosteroid isomerase-like protein